MSHSPGGGGPARAIDEVEHKLGERVRMLERRQVAALVEEMQRRVGQQALVLLAADRGDDPVLASPDDQGRRLYPRQEMGQTRVEHVRLPRERSEEHRLNSSHT